MKVLVTNANSFVGKNLCVALQQRMDVELTPFDFGDAPGVLARGLAQSELVFHIATARGPEHAERSKTGDDGLLDEVLGGLRTAGGQAKVVLALEVEERRDTFFGTSKREEEEALRQHCDANRSEGVAFRLHGPFGKWCQPSTGSVVAAMANAIANDVPFRNSEPAKTVDLTYVDDVVAALVGQLDEPPKPGFTLAEPLRPYSMSLGELETLLQSFRAHRSNGLLPDYSNPLVRALYATYLSYLKPETYGYQLDIKTDDRGGLAEFIKSPRFGLVFISRTKPGITRGNHFHHTKTEKFLVVQGEGMIRLRQIHGDHVVEFRCRGEEFRVVDIPPGYTHSIENVGAGEMVTVFWSSELFDPARPDTVISPVLREKM